MEHATLTLQLSDLLRSAIQVIYIFYHQVFKARNINIHTSSCGTRDGRDSRRDCDRDCGRDCGRDNAGCIDIRINKFFETVSR